MSTSAAGTGQHLDVRGLRKPDKPLRRLPRPADGVIETHVGPALDVTIQVRSGTGTLTGERGSAGLVALETGRGREGVQR